MSFAHLKAVRESYVNDSCDDTVSFPSPHYAYVRTRWRNSGLTSVRWYDDQTLYAGDFAAKAAYRVKPFSPAPANIDAQIPTLDGAGNPTATDLMDIRGNVMAMTNFYTGEVALYTVGPDVLRFDRVIVPPVHPPSSRKSSWWRSLIGRKPKPFQRRAHGVCFVPGYDDLLWVSYCDSKDRGVEIVTLDGTPVHSLRTSEQAQDVAFVEHEGVTYAIQAGRTDHISVKEPNGRDIYVTLYVYRMPKDLRTEAPELLTSQRFEGHLDAMKAWRGSVFAANQFCSSVDEFVYSPESNKIELKRRLTGFDMPHGLDIRHDGLMAVTNYGPANDMRFFQLS